MRLRPSGTAHPQSDHGGVGGRSQWRPDFNAYLNRHMPATVQQAATIYGLRESVLRGVAEKGWGELAEKVLLPTADSREPRC